MGEEKKFLEQLQQRLAPARARLADHPLYGSIETVEDLRCFMESHVFAVWDFMSLLKALQRGLTCVELPWVPSAMPEARRLINQIVAGEESDVYEGQAASHFELYLEAMRECGAATEGIESLLKRIRSGASVSDAIEASRAPSSGRIPEAARCFVAETFSLLEQDKLHMTAAAFTFGREDLIPDLFRGMVRKLNAQMAGRLGRFVWYLERHIEVDGEEHGPMALRMVAELCGSDAGRWTEAAAAAEKALDARLALWDGIVEAMRGARASMEMSAVEVVQGGE